MRFGRRFATTFALGILPGCAALASWDGYVAEGTTSDAGQPTDTGSATNDGGTATPDAAPTAITVVQSAKLSFAIHQDTVDVPFPSPVGAGNAIIVAVGWYDVVNDVASISDSQGSTYTLATGPTKLDGSQDPMTQKIYFAAGVVGGTSSLHITFSTKVDSPDIRAIEVHGLDPSAPFVDAGDNSGHDTNPTAGPVTTTAPRGLLFAAAITSQGFDSCASDYATCVISSPEDENVAEARVLDAPGSFSITNPIRVAGDWVMQLVAFK